jgi:CelD/BcsL family acetyltransferase involved in cellulose biosynthesis
VPEARIATVCVVRVTLVDDLGALQGEWTALYANDPTATPFASFEWLSAWYRHWADGGTPWILAVYDGERLAGLAAFLLRGRGGLRFLSGLGVGVGNYWDVIAAPGDREQAVAAVAAELRRRSSEWDAFFMDKLPEESLTTEALRGAGLRVERIMRLASPRIELPTTFEDYLAVVSSRRRRDIRRRLRALDAGELSIRPVSDPDGLRSAIERWQALKVEWWARRDMPMDPEHGSRRFLDFTIEALTAMVPRAQAAVWEMCHGDEVIAIKIGLLDENTFYGWLFGFDSRFENLQPGHMLIAYGIRWSIQEKLRYYDFMLGAESYKYHYAPRDRAVLTATVGSPRLRSRATLRLSHLRHAALPAGMRIPVFGR